jgi:hypothetical protein
MTGLLREEIEREPDGQLSRTVIYDDYREIDGVFVAHKILQITQLGETRQEVEIAVQRVHHGDVRGEVFEIPQAPAPEPVPDELMDTFEDARMAAKEDPKDASAAFRYASSAWASGHFEEAGRAAAAMIKLAPRDPAALFILGRVQVLTGRFKAAERTLKKAQKAGAHPERIAHHLATARLHRRDFAGAAKLFEAAGETALAHRYGAFEGKPLQPSWAGNGCETTLPLLADLPVPVVEVTIEDESLNLLVDTSAADLILDPDRARKLVISTDSASELGGPGGAQIGHGQADKLIVGDLTLQRVPVDIFPPQVLAEMAVDPRVHGVLGVRPFLDTQVTVDLTARTLTIVRNSPKCKKALNEHRKGVVVPFWLYETHILYVPGKMNGSRGLYLVNSGMRGAALAANGDAYARAGVGAPVLRRGDPGAFVTIDRFGIHDDFEVQNASAAWGYIAANATRDEFRFDGMVGLEILGQRRWTIDYAQRRFYFVEPAPAPAKTKAEPKAKGKAKDATPAKKTTK